VGTPQGTGSGLATQPSVESRKRTEGEIKKIDSTRTNRIIEVGDVTLEIEPGTVILVDCKRASVAELKEGTKVKVAYEVKSNNRNLATVIKTQK
jgi:Cu/Ag efflux protein CusF